MYNIHFLFSQLPTPTKLSPCMLSGKYYFYFTPPRPAVFVIIFANIRRVTH